MIHRVRFADFLAALHALGFARVGETDADLLFLREGDGSVLSIHRPNGRGEVTEAPALAAFDAAEVEPPTLDVHWCD